MTAVEFLEKICKDRGYHLMEEYFYQAKQMESDKSKADCDVARMQGWNKGYEDGLDEGFSKGYEEGYEDGRK